MCSNSHQYEWNEYQSDSISIKSESAPSVINIRNLQKTLETSPFQSFLSSPSAVTTISMVQGLKELSDLVKSYQGLRENEQRGGERGNGLCWGAFMVIG